MRKMGLWVGVLGLLITFMSVPAMAVEPKGQTVWTDPSCWNTGQYSRQGFMGYDWSRYPGSTEICYRWIPPHRVPMRMTLPGGWVYRRVWVPHRQVIRYRWQEGFWQVTGTNMRPDVYRWRSYQQSEESSQPDQSSQNGYFNAYGMWIPQR